MRIESSGKPDAWKLARPVWGWGRGAIPRPTPLRTLLVVVTLFGIPCSWLAVKMQQVRREREAAATLTKSGAQVLYDFQRLPLSMMRKKKWDEHVGYVYYSPCDDGTLQEMKRQLARLPYLDELVVRGDGVTDAGLEHLEGLTQLRRLTLEHSKVTDEGVRKLQLALPNCEIER